MPCKGPIAAMFVVGLADTANAIGPLDPPVHDSTGTAPSRIAIADSVDGELSYQPTQLEDVWDWLPDGSFMGGAWRTDENGRQEEIAVESATGELTFLTDTPIDHEGVPRLSPDGTRITFLSWSPVTNHYSLGVMNRDGSDLRTFDEGTQVFWPAWSPSGSEIAIGPFPTGIRPDGTGAHALTHGGGSGDGGHAPRATLPGIC